MPTKTTSDSPVIFADAFTGFDATKDTKEGEHPNASGDAKLANTYFEALKAAATTV